jgi:di/tricarboxylate transporter
MGIATSLDFGPHSNVAKGLFIALTYTASLFNKMFLNGNVSIMASGFIEEQTGSQVLWSQWFIAFFPTIICTIIVSWLTIRWLFPADIPMPSATQPAVQNSLQHLGPWSHDERKTLIWLSLAIILWATDFLHHTSPAVIGLGIGLILILPGVGVLDNQAIKSLNILLIFFVGGTLSMGRVLTETKALDLLTESLEQWLAPWLSHALYASTAIYWGGFLYHLLIGSEYTMVSTLLPVLSTCRSCRNTTWWR